jgi:hypothetical protein
MGFVERWVWFEAFLEIGVCDIWMILEGVCCAICVCCFGWAAWTFLRVQVGLDVR